MPHRISHEQIAARDAAGLRHVVRVTRVPVPGAPHLKGPPRYTWNDGRVLHLVDVAAGVLECSVSGERLVIEDWRG